MKILDFRLKTILLIKISVILLTVVFSCSRQNTTPTVSTTPISNITFTTAESGGNITSDGGALITSSGVCWSTNPSPTISDSKTSEGTISYTSIITGLLNDTKYFTRAYATNIEGTSYGNELVIDTKTIDNTNWDIIFVEDSVVSFNYVPKVKIDFIDDGTTVSEDHDYPGVFSYGNWSVIDSTIHFDPGLDPLAISYVFTGIANGNDMSGSYTWGNTGSKVFIAEKLP